MTDNIDNPTPLNGIMVGMTIEGDIQSNSDIVIRGTLEGNLTCKAMVTIDTTGIIKGNVQAQDALVIGLIKGNLNTSAHTFISETGNIKGNISTKKLVVEDGATFSKIKFTG